MPALKISAVSQSCALSGRGSNEATAAAAKIRTVLDGLTGRGQATEAEIHISLLPNPGKGDVT